jgi:hypothetical protein
MALAGILSASCASTPAPREKAAASQTAVHAAEEVGARDVPQAGQYLDLAQKELDQGNALMRAGKNHEAASSFAMSQADAEVALALARESRTREAALQAKTRAQALRQQVQGSAVGGGPVQAVPPPTPAPAPKPAEPPAPLTPPARPPQPEK